MPVCSYECQVPIDPAQPCLPNERPTTLLLVCPYGRQVSINPTSGGSLKELPSLMLPVHSLKRQVPISSQPSTGPSWDVPDTCDPMRPRTVRSFHECQVPVATDSPSPRGHSFLKEAHPMPVNVRHTVRSSASCVEIHSDGSTLVSASETSGIHEAYDPQSSIRTEGNGLSRIHFFNT